MELRTCCWMWTLALGAALHGCSSAPPPRGERASGAPPAPAARATGSASTAASPPSATAPEAPPAAAAPCDLSRVYRGAVGGAGVTLRLRRTDAGDLSGEAAYDAGAGALSLDGRIEGDQGFSLRELDRSGQAVGRYEGRCRLETGALEGTWARGAATKPFALAPGGADAVPLVERRKRFTVPRENPGPCAYDVVRPAVFGLGSAEREGRINLALHHGPSLLDPRLEAHVRRCAPPWSAEVKGGYSVAANTSGLLSVILDGWTYIGPAVHSDVHVGLRVASIDVPTGRELRLEDVIADKAELREMVKACLPFASEALDINEWELERLIHGVPAEDDVPSSIHDPDILVLEDGIAALITGGVPFAGAGIVLKGPVLSWSGLLSRRVLKASSPIARLWAKARPLARGEPLCTRIFSPGDTSPDKPG
ncbi:hypothetical protein BE20_23325 [Sorangium cellulosum]|nr:hypothetical protein BE20_23325 [Sorangium cellulosum]